MSNEPEVIFPDFQNVYIEPPSYVYWKKHSKCREGTIFVKKLLRKVKAPNGSPGILKRQGVCENKIYKMLRCIVQKKIYGKNK